MKTILITKHLNEVLLLEACCNAYGLQLIAQSFIRFEAVKAVIPEQMDALFFGSRRAAEFFMQQAEIPAGCEIACIGETTARHLQALGLKIHFTGTNAGDPESVARDLKTWLGGRKLYIAQSGQSNRSMASALPAEQVAEIVVYETIPAPELITAQPDFIAFTSPSNLHGFLLTNEIPGDANIIAWGKTTEKALHALGLKAHEVLQNASEKEVIDILVEAIRE